MIVSLDHVFKYYGADCILRDVCAAINEKDRIGLVGANGEGKTTLLNVLTGALDYEEGTIGRTNGKVIGYLKQNSGLANGKTIQQEMEAVFADLLALRDEINALQKKMAQVHDDPAAYEAVSAEYQKKLARFEARDGYQIEVKINTILGGMGFGSYDRNIITDNLSGGEKTRLATARLLLMEPDLLILDEPTNHLDIGSKEMLEDALERFDGTIIMVSHDRYLLNRIPTKIIEMSADGYETYNGRYDYYLEHKIEPQVKKVEVSEEKKQASQKFYKTKADRAKQAAQRKRIAFLEKTIEENEATIEELTAKMSDPAIAADYQQVEEICQKIEELKNQNEEFGEEWLLLSEDE